MMWQASAALIAAGVAAGALAVRYILRSASGAGGAAGPGFFKRLQNMTGGVEKGFENPMSRSEAAKILGISARASKEDIAKVHRKLMVLNHPDRGGSPYIATKVNEAKEVLTGTGRSNPFG